MCRWRSRPSTEGSRAGADEGGRVTPKKPVSEGMEARPALGDDVPHGVNRVSLLGPVEVVVNGRRLGLGPPLQRALLAVLSLRHGHVVTADHLVDALWGDVAPRTAHHSVQIYVSELRKAFGCVDNALTISTLGVGYRLDLGSVVLDLDVFERLAESGRRALPDDPAVAATALTEALSLWGGAVLPEFADRPFAEVARARLGAVRLAAYEDLAEARLALGEPEGAIAATLLIQQEDPLRDRACELRMLALYRCGRQAEALEEYGTHRRRLATEVGLDPTPVLRQLHERILIHDPAIVRGSADGRVAGATRNPYKGLHPFSEEDHRDFFGRGSVVEGLLSRIRGGARLTVLVGPSGSGKSSILAAGVVAGLNRGVGESSEPRAEAGGDVVWLLPEECTAGRVARIARTANQRRRVLIVVDHFEQIFHVHDDEGVQSYLTELAHVLSAPAGGVAALLALRADCYDRPLTNDAFARLFVASVVPLLPMNPQELESSIVKPSLRAGVAIERALVAQLVVEATGRASVLPLLQFALTELFERRRGGELTHRDHVAIGGLSGALEGRAESVREAMSPAQRTILEQVLLRLVTVAGGTPARHRLRVAELNALDLGGSDLAAVLDALRCHHLIAFDRDDSGAAIVEIAHEALFREWPWLAELIERQGLTLRRHASLRRLVQEWTEVGRADDYLVTGTRLTEYLDWRRGGSLLLTDDEGDLLDRSEARVLARDREERDRAANQRALERRSRVRVLASATVALLAVSSGVFFAATRTEPLRVTYIRATSSFIEGRIQAGIDRAAGEVAVSQVPMTYDDSIAIPEAFARLDGDVGVVISSMPELDLGALAREYPEVHFASFEAVPGASRSNVTTLEFADQESAYLAGAAAALASTTGKVAFLGGVDTAILMRFRAGFENGATAVRPSVQVVSAWVSRYPSFAGFTDPPLAHAAALVLLRDGVDVVFAAAGAAQFGALQAVDDEATRTGRQLWGIGADDDAHALVDWQRTTTAGDRVLTSTIKRFDIASHDVVVDAVAGELTGGRRVYSLANGALGLAESGGHLAPFGAQLAELKQAIVEGRVVPACVPEGVTGEIAEAAAAGAHCPP